MATDAARREEAAARRAEEMAEEAARKADEIAAKMAEQTAKMQEENAKLIAALAGGVPAGPALAAIAPGPNAAAVRQEKVAKLSLALLKSVKVKNF